MAATQIGLANIPSSQSKWDIIRALMPVLHAEEFSPPGERKLNFKVKLDYPEDGGTRHLSTGTIIVPREVAQKFIAYVKANPIKLDENKLKFYIKGPARSRESEIVPKTPFIDPGIQEEHQEILWQLDEALRVNAVQFGILFRETYPSSDSERPTTRSYSIEWEHDAVKGSVAYLRFEYDHKLMRVTIGDPATEDTGRSIAIPFESIQRIGTGYDPQPYVCFDTLTPPSFQEIDFFFDESDRIRHKRRLGSVHPGHALVAPYAYHLRLVLFNYRMNDILDKFEGMCTTCKISQTTIIRCEGSNAIEARGFGFFRPVRIYKLRKEIAKFPWGVAFQLEALLHNGILHTQDVENLLPTVRRLCSLDPEKDKQYVALLLRRYAELLRRRPIRESPSQCFERTREEYVPLESKLSKGNFLSCHVTFTPSRTLMEGPNPMQSNRIIREYEGYEEHFIRVDFSEEDRLSYKWERGVDLYTILTERVGNVLKNGFNLAGRPFEFLAYSNSALRNHSVWFINPFEHPKKGYIRPGVEKRLVNAEFIRETIGNFKDTDLLRQPSKYAARLGQAFTATDPSVRVSREEFEEVDDIGEKGYEHTDGVGTISESLRDEIWEKLKRPGAIVVKPSAYQIRFMGYKGVVCVDPLLDHDGNGIRMRLRPSMNKFENTEEKTPEIEIARSFMRPNKCYLNRPLIMFLEDLGVERRIFEELQDEAVADARTIHNSTPDFCKVLDAHSLGRQFRLSYTLKRLKEKYGLDLQPQNNMPGIDTQFLRQVRQIAMLSVLRDIKHGARIPVSDGYLLVGVADEGPVYKEKGHKDVFTLKEGQIYACVQDSPDDEPVWLQGPCTVSRSPVVHPGDIQRVEAIGKPPEDRLCLFAKLKNVVVLPSTGGRSLASMLGGGDLDGDLFSVIMYPKLLPMSWEEPAKYPKESPYDLERDTRVEDICDFIVQYISSDVLGLLSDRLLTIADQSKEGIFDSACLKLAHLCSKAVDYPKNGNPVVLSNLPSTLIREKPDWHRAEVVTWRDSDYYESDKALGYLFRAISLESEETEQNHINGNGIPLMDPVSLALGPIVEYAMGRELEEEEEEEVDDQTKDLFRKYVNELSYICSTHTISPRPNVQLQEAEIVVGTILDKCVQKRYRNERMHGMRIHASTLVEDIERQLVDKSLNPGPVEWRVGLERAWRAWGFSQRNSSSIGNSAFGMNSFGLIALGTILDCLDNL
ncbi:hypothetical protein AX15_000237 [Amanita polypyramis BW_CC]|nr:hypothetical protein AX15_000237 [Amanita polypyramis BW_CC]